jgi:hypothetical protein
MQCLDHVIPRAQLGPNSYRNLVSSCMECNSRKGARPAPDFLRSLYREGRLTGAELIRALQSLNDLAAGNLRPIGFVYQRVYPAALCFAGLPRCSDPSLPPRLYPAVFS